MLSNLSMNSMAKMSDMLESIGRPSLWRKMQFAKAKYMLWSVILSRSTMSCLERWYVLCLILLTVLFDGFLDRYGCARDTTCGLHGYGSALFFVVGVSVLYAVNEFVTVLQVCWNIL